MFEQGAGFEHSPNFLFAEHNGEFLVFLYLRQMQIGIGQAFCFEQKPQAVNGVFEIGLGGGFALFLKQKEVVQDLLLVEQGRNFTEVERD